MKKLLIAFILIACLFITGSYINFMHTVVDGTELLNSGYNMITRTSGFEITKTVNITGTGAQAANVLQVTGTVLIINQWAEITAITTLTNLTNVYATLYDGTNTVDLTADGVTLSTATVGSYFTKDQVSTETYSVNIADECRLLETVANKYAGRPFLVTQKNGTDTFIRFHYTTTDNPIDFDIKIVFEYIPQNGGTLEFL